MYTLVLYTIIAKINIRNIMYTLVLYTIIAKINIRGFYKIQVSFGTSHRLTLVSQFIPHIYISDTYNSYSKISFTHTLDRINSISDEQTCQMQKIIVFIYILWCQYMFIKPINTSA